MTKPINFFFHVKFVTYLIRKSINEITLEELKAVNLILNKDDKNSSVYTNKFVV